MTKASILVVAAVFACGITAISTARAADASHNVANPFATGAMSDAAMAKLRGGHDGPFAFQNAESSGNQCNLCSSGKNSVNANSFGNATGIFSVIQNSGSNALIQSTTQVNVSLGH